MSGNQLYARVPLHPASGPYTRPDGRHGEATAPPADSLGVSRPRVRNPHHQPTGRPRVGSRGGRPRQLPGGASHHQTRLAGGGSWVKSVSWKTRAPSAAGMTSVAWSATGTWATTKRPTTASRQPDFPA